MEAVLLEILPHCSHGLPCDVNVVPLPYLILHFAFEYEGTSDLRWVTGGLLINSCAVQAFLPKVD